MSDSNLQPGVWSCCPNTAAALSRLCCSVTTQEGQQSWHIFTLKAGNHTHPCWTIFYLKNMELAGRSLICCFHNFLFVHCGRVGFKQQVKLHAMNHNRSCSSSRGKFKHCHRLQATGPHRQEFELGKGLQTNIGCLTKRHGYAYVGAYLGFTTYHQLSL